MKFSRTAIFVASLLLTAVPLVGLAQIIINEGDPVPVPYNTQFFFGPAGELTASGLIIRIINILLLVAGLVAVLFVIIGGFRYVTAAGNEEQSEAAKKTLTHAILGLIIIILSFVIVRVISNALVFGRFGT